MKNSFSLLATVIFSCTTAFAQQIPAGQDVGSTVKGYKDRKARSKIVEKIREERSLPPSLDAPKIQELPKSVQSAHIDTIVVQQSPLAEEYVEEDELKSIIEGYQARHLTLEEMRSIAQEITQRYADKGVRAYIPKQGFEDKTLYINLIEE